jgi:cobyrinic acid a,c-diamide synthase
MDFPRIVMSALRGGSGKTVISIGIIAAWKQRGIPIAPYKKGPDYIDAGWLALAGSRPCYNLDTYLIDSSRIFNSFMTHTHPGDVAVIEGNRGLYDGIDMSGSTSTAELAKLLDAPVILCLDCTKSTRTMAAALLGCLHFDPNVQISGVILNHVAGARHEAILRKSIEGHCGIPVFGALPKLNEQNFPERHMGLVPTAEHEWANESVAAIAAIAEKYLDIDAILQVAHSAQNTLFSHHIESFTPHIETGQKPTIGIIRDSAFQFYYPENIEALRLAGAEIVFFSPLTHTSLPKIDALYIGGGFPETHAQELAENKSFREELKHLAENGLPIYAECGGLMYLGKELILEEKSYPMAGVLPLSFGLFKRPQGHGYTEIEVTGQNPYFDIGEKILGHEFHYSRVLSYDGDENSFAFLMKRGVGLLGNKDGCMYKNVLATYTHIHALGTPSWAGAMVKAAIAFSQIRSG